MSRCIALLSCPMPPLIQVGARELRVPPAKQTSVCSQLYKLNQKSLANIPTAAFLENFAAKNSAWAVSKNAEFLSEEGASFPYVHLASKSNSTGSKVRVWIQGSVHGNEPAGDEAVLALLGALDADPTWAAGFLDKLEIIALPRYNPDGNACEYEFL
jgi:hypothetical protein